MEPNLFSSAPSRKSHNFPKDLEFLKQGVGANEDGGADMYKVGAIPVGADLGVTFGNTFGERSDLRLVSQKGHI